METSNQNGKGQTAYLLSPPVSSSSGSHCLSFFYHMKGKTMGTLNVYVVDTVDPQKHYALLTTITGDQGNNWHYEEVTIASLCKYQVNHKSIKNEPIQTIIFINIFSSFSGRLRGSTRKWLS